MLHRTQPPGNLTLRALGLPAVAQALVPEVVHQQAWATMLVVALGPRFSQEVPAALRLHQWGRPAGGPYLLERQGPHLSGERTLSARAGPPVSLRGTRPAGLECAGTLLRWPSNTLTATLPVKLDVAPPVQRLAQALEVRACRITR